MPNSGQHAPQRWFFASAAALAAVAARASLQPLLGDELPLAIAFPAAVLSAIVWGAGAGFLVALVCASASLSGLVAPQMAGRPMQVGAFLLTCVLVGLVSDRVKRQGTEGVEGASHPADETALTSWLRTVLFGAFILPAVAFAVIAWWGFQRAQVDALATVLHAADLTHGQALRTFSVAVDVAKRADLASASVGASSEQAVHQRLADIASGLPFVVAITVWDANGNGLARSDAYPDPVDRALSVADRPYFQDLQAGRTSFSVSEVLNARRSGRQVINATIRRSSADGSFRGIVAVSLAPEYFRAYYETLGSEQPNLASFALIRTDGEILARWPRTPDARTHVPADSPTLKGIVAGQASGQLEMPASPGREARIIAFKRLDGFPLYVATGVSRQAMFASWARFVSLLAAVLLPTTAGLVYVSWVALKKTQREVRTAAQLRDQISRRANAERSMLQSQKLETLAVVTGGVAHDFNNLLAILSASLHVHRRLHPGLADDKQIMAMKRSIESGVRLTRQLLSFTRKQALRPEAVVLQEWLPATEGLIRTTLGANVVWQLRIEQGTRVITVDPGELELAIINLVVNSRHAMPQGGVLTLSACNAAHPADASVPMVSISVTDTGIGIPADLLPKVMEPFFTTREKGVGSGLGLSQVQGFCAQAGGQVAIESELGKGTTVRMLLPATDLPHPASAPASELETLHELHGRILLIEDNEDVGATTAAMLGAAGMTVTRLPNADAAMAFLREDSSRVDVVLSDIAMPGSMNGIGLAFALRQRHPDLPVLLTTGYAEQLNEALAGGLRVLQKPTVPNELLAELRALMSSARAPVGGA